MLRRTVKHVFGSGKAAGRRVSDENRKEEDRKGVAAISDPTVDPEATIGLPNRRSCKQPPERAERNGQTRLVFQDFEGCAAYQERRAACKPVPGVHLISFLTSGHRARRMGQLTDPMTYESRTGLAALL